MSRTFHSACRAIAAAVLGASAACGESTKPQAAASLAFDAQPSNAVAGASISPSVRVRVLDASGAAYTGPMTVRLTLSSANGASLLGTTSVAAANGVATFPDIRVEKAGAGYVLNASAGSLAQVASNPFDVTHGAAVTLRFVAQPTPAFAGKPFDPAVGVELLDLFDNRATGATHAITVAIAPGNANARVIGTTTVDAVAGIATFDKISLNRIGSYALTATAQGLAPATSSSFTVALTTTARFCPPDVSSGASFGSFEDAIEATEPGGTIVVCDGTHQVTVIMNRPLTVVGEHPHAATLTPVAPDRHVIWVREGGPGTYAFRDLSFVLEGNNGVFALGTAPTNPPVGRYDQVIIENNRFSVTSQPGVGMGVAISSSSIPTAKVIVRGNTFAGGTYGVRVDGARAVEISNNEFTDQLTAPFDHNASIELANGGPYTVRNNLVRPCPGRCIMSTYSAAEIVGNTVTTAVERTTQVGIEVIGGTAAITGNVIRGSGEVVRRDDLRVYAFKAAGIRVAFDGVATVTENTIINADYGIFPGIDATVSGSNNTITLTFAPVLMTTRGPDLHRNDFTEFSGIGHTGKPPAGALSCNYWGPTGPVIPTGMNDVFAPTSPVPIANKPAVIC